MCHIKKNAIGVQKREIPESWTSNKDFTTEARSELSISWWVEFQLIGECSDQGEKSLLLTFFPLPSSIQCYYPGEINGK